MDETKLRPFPARPPPSTSDSTLKFFINMTGTGSWALNIGPHQAFRQQLPPLLWDDDSRGETTYSEGSLRNGSVVDIIFENGANVTTQHPFHKHNNKAFIIGTGTGGFPWASVDEAIRHGGQAKNFNFVDPPLRDGCRLGNQTGDWTVIRYDIAFPAASMLHCHMIHHFGVSPGNSSHLPAHLFSFIQCRNSLVPPGANPLNHRLGSRSYSWRASSPWPGSRPRLSTGPTRSSCPL